QVGPPPMLPPVPAVPPPPLVAPPPPLAVLAPEPSVLLPEGPAAVSPAPPVPPAEPHPKATRSTEQQTSATNNSLLMGCLREVSPMEHTAPSPEHRVAILDLTAAARVRVALRRGVCDRHPGPRPAHRSTRGGASMIGPVHRK